MKHKARRSAGPFEALGARREGLGEVLWGGKEKGKNKGKQGPHFWPLQGSGRRLLQSSGAQEETSLDYTVTVSDHEAAAAGSQALKAAESDGSLLEAVKEAGSTFGGVTGSTVTAEAVSVNGLGEEFEDDPTKIPAHLSADFPHYKQDPRGHFMWHWDDPDLPIYMMLQTTSITFGLILTCLLLVVMLMCYCGCVCAVHTSDIEASAINPVAFMGWIQQQPVQDQNQDENDFRRK